MPATPPRRRRQEENPDGIYTAQRIVQTRVHKGRREYLVKWKDYPNSANTWEPIENIIDASLLTDYEEEQARIAAGLTAVERARERARRAAEQGTPTRNSVGSHPTTLNFSGGEQVETEQQVAKKKDSSSWTQFFVLILVGIVIGVLLYNYLTK